MYCPACGKQNLDDARFCAGCGASIAANTAGPTATGYSTMRGGTNREPRSAARDTDTGRVLAFLTPLGQFYNGEAMKGIVLLIALALEVGLIASIFGSVFGLLLMVATWYWAFRDARAVQQGLKEPW